MSVYSSVRHLRLEKRASSGLADTPIRLIQDLLKPTVGAMGQKTRLALQESRFRNMSAEYKSVFQRITREDPILQDYDDKKGLQEAYKVMIKFAPTLALEPLVARSFLRMFAQGDGVIPEQSVQRLAEAEGKHVGN